MAMEACSALEGFQPFYRLFQGDWGVAVVDVQEGIAVIAHPQLLHISDLPEAVAGLHPLDEGVVLFFLHRVNEVDRSRVDRQDIGRGEDADIGGDDRFRGCPFAVAGDRHVAHDVDIDDPFAEVVGHRFGRFGHPLHELLVRDVPHIVRAGGGVDRLFAGLAAGAADADIFIGAAEAALGMAFEVGQDEEGVVVFQVFAHLHLLR